MRSLFCGVNIEMKFKIKITRAELKEEIKVSLMACGMVALCLAVIIILTQGFI